MAFNQLSHNIIHSSIIGKKLVVYYTRDYEYDLCFAIWTGQVMAKEFTLLMSLKLKNLISDFLLPLKVKQGTDQQLSRRYFKAIYILSIGANKTQTHFQ